MKKSLNFRSINKLKIVQSVSQRLSYFRSSLFNLVHNKFNVNHRKAPVKKLKIFQQIKSGLKIVNFSASPLSNPFDRAHFIRTIRSTLSVLFQLIYLIRGAKSAKEYINSTYIITASIALILSLLNTIYKSEQMYQFFDKFENFINTSKYLVALFTIAFAK